MKLLWKISFFVLIALAAFNFSFAQTITQPDLTPSRTNQEEKAIIDEGTALHDQEKYDEAITKYKQVLGKNPNNILAIYEMAYSYFAAANYEQSLNTATQGARYKSDYLAQFYMMIGNSLDELGKTADAISAFKQAIVILPTNALIRFNLAVTLSNTGALDDARSHLKTAIQLDPRHASSHYALGQLFYQQDYRFPSTLALMRFLTFEPTSKRSEKALSMIDENFEHGVELKGSKNIQITVPKNSSNEEGDFTKYDLMLSLVEASKTSEKESKSTKMEMLVQSLDKLISMMSEMNENQKGKFVFDYYFPYFIALKKSGLVAPFTHYIYQSTDQQASLWVKNHPDEVQRFVEWSSSYK